MENGKKKHPLNDEKIKSFGSEGVSLQIWRNFFFFRLKLYWRLAKLVAFYTKCSQQRYKAVHNIKV